MLIAGIDEAGRGCVIGPLVIAGILVKEENLPKLAEMGVKDSKLLTPEKREQLYPQILKLCENQNIIKITPQQIDKVANTQRTNHKLNRLEAQTMAQIIETLKPDHTYVDAADTLEQRFKNHIQECLTTKAKITSKHKADKIYPIVSAASIIAKVTRDQEIQNLKQQHGDFGTGYLNDKKTTQFLKQLIQNNNQYPPYIRASWKPAKKAKNEKGTTQTTLA